MTKKLLRRNLATSLILYEKIQTTLAKAKVTRSLVEKNIQIAKRGVAEKRQLSAQKRLLANLLDKKAAVKIFEVLVPRYQKTISGFVEIIKLDERWGDGAPLALVRLKKVSPKDKEDKQQDQDGKN